jgi:hypothetical protein
MNYVSLFIKISLSTLACFALAFLFGWASGIKNFEDLAKKFDDTAGYIDVHL